MLRAVRDWWDSGRARYTLRLFAFEFIVVMAGVLAAQGLQGWVSRQNAEGAMREARDRARLQLGNDLVNARAWKVAIPCLDARMVQVMSAASRGPVDPDLISRPSFATFVPIRIDDQSELLLRANGGRAEADEFAAIAGDIDHAAKDIGEIVHSWGRLSLTDPSLGPATGLDRSQVRTAAADIRAELRGLDYALADVIERSAKIGVTPGAGQDGHPAANCAQIWRSGSVTIRD